jgi:hypothetical protein
MHYSNREMTWTVFGIVTLAICAIGASMLPELWRYLKIRSM